MSKKISLVSLFVAVLLTACVPELTNPLTVPGAQALDKTLFGSWILHDKEEHSFLHIGQEEGGKNFSILIVDIHKPQTISSRVYRGHNSSVGDKVYLNIEVLDDKNKLKAYMLVRYSVAGSDLKISLVDTSSIEKAIKAGKLAGKVDDKPQTISVTADAAALQAFVTSNDSELFKKFAPFKKVVLPPL